MKNIITLLLVLSTQGLFCYTYCFAQNNSPLSLDSCFRLAESNYPQIKQYDLIKKSTEYSIKNAQKGKLPQLMINGQASYQSEVTTLPGGFGMEVPELSKDQYQLYGEVIQPLTGLTIVNSQKQILEIEGELNRSDLDVKIYSIKQRVSDLYFGILLIQNQQKQSELAREDLKMGLSRIEASVTYGSALSNSSDILKAQIINIDQRIIEQEATKSGYLKMLGLFINREINSKTVLIKPAISISDFEINRPEIKYYDRKIESIMLENDLTRKSNLPQFNLFLQSGYGRPALNFLSNDFEPYYIGGVKLSWNLSNYYTYKGKKQLYSINQRLVEAEKESFLFNTKISLANQQTQISKAIKLIEKDKEIIRLRENVLAISKGQLENGTITPSDYKSNVIDADEARQNLALHEIELLKIKNDLRLTSGN